jgi:hypothetical protein
MSFFVFLDFLQFQLRSRETKFHYYSKEKIVFIPFLVSTEEVAIKLDHDDKNYYIYLKNHTLQKWKLN